MPELSREEFEALKAEARGKRRRRKRVRTALVVVPLVALLGAWVAWIVAQHVGGEGSPAVPGRYQNYRYVEPGWPEHCRDLWTERNGHLQVKQYLACLDGGRVHVP